MSFSSFPLRIAGVGAVSPAGWGVEALYAAINQAQPLPVEENRRVSGAPRQRLRRVPAPSSPLPFARDPRLRRTSPISRFAVGAALEAVGEERLAAVRAGACQLGVVYVVTNGCVNFSRRFYAEALENPATASPLLFPETVFNAPSSHLAALLGTGEVNYTLVGDGAQFFAAFELAAQWLEAGEIEACLLVAAEELDWLTAEAVALFDREAVLAEGAAAVYVEAVDRAQPGDLTVESGRPWPLSARRGREAAACAVCEEWAARLPQGARLADSRLGASRTDAPETNAWQDWPGARLPVGEVLGAGFTALAGWQCVAAVATLRAAPEVPGVLLSHVGYTQLAHSLWVARVPEAERTAKVVE